MPWGCCTPSPGISSALSLKSKATMQDGHQGKQTTNRIRIQHKILKCISMLLVQCIRTFPWGRPIKEPEKYNQSAVRTLLSPLNIQLLCQNSLLQHAFHIANSESGRFQPLQLVQITCWNSSFLSSSISNLKITWVRSSSRYWWHWMLWWWLTHNTHSTMSETSGTTTVSERRDWIRHGHGHGGDDVLQSAKGSGCRELLLFFFSLGVSDLY